jgi:hypothetical protein
MNQLLRSAIGPGSQPPLVRTPPCTKACSTAKAEWHRPKHEALVLRSDETLNVGGQRHLLAANCEVLAELGNLVTTTSCLAPVRLSTQTRLTATAA